MLILLLSSNVSGQEELRLPFGSNDEQFRAAVEKRKAKRTVGKIRSVSLHKTRVSDRGLTPLRQLKGLQSLSLSDTRISDAGLQHLEKLTRLKTIDLFATRISDKGLQMLSRMKSLQRAALRKTGITDAGLAHLAKRKKLEYLDLRETRITDAGLLHLKALTQLRQLDLRETRCTAEGIRVLAKALPDCQIQPSPSPAIAPPPARKPPPLVREPKPSPRKPDGPEEPTPEKRGTQKSTPNPKPPKPGQAQEEEDLETGVLAVHVTPPEGVDPDQIRVQLYDFSDLFRVAEMLLIGDFLGTRKGSIYRLSRELEAMRVRSVKSSRDGNIHRLKVRPGTYHVRVLQTTGDSRWVADQKIATGKEHSIKVPFEKTGEVEILWNIDRGTLITVGPGNGTYKKPSGKAFLHLVRDGVIYATREAPMKTAFTWTGIPAGTYSVVTWSSKLSDDFLWVEDNIKVRSGKRTRKAIQVRRTSLGTLQISPYDAKKKRYLATKEHQWLLDQKLRFAIPPKGQAANWVGNSNKRRLTYYSWFAISSKTTIKFIALFRIPGYETTVKRGIRFRRPVVKTKPIFPNSSMKDTTVTHAKKKIPLSKK
jgi:hypothetical protein